MIDNIQIQIPSLPENIRIVESFIDNAKDQYKLNDDIYGNIMIAVTESVNNAIIHGNQSNSKKERPSKPRARRIAHKIHD